MSDQAIFSQHVRTIRALVREARAAATGSSCAVPLSGLSLRAADQVADEMNQADRVHAEVRDNKLHLTW